MTGGEPELSRLVANLLVNWVRYPPPDGTVVVDTVSNATRSG